MCAEDLNYHANTASLLPIYPTLIRTYRTLIFNGDVDGCVPYIGNEVIVIKMSVFKGLMYASMYIHIYTLVLHCMHIWWVTPVLHCMHIWWVTPVLHCMHIWWVTPVLHCMHIWWVTPVLHCRVCTPVLHCRVCFSVAMDFWSRFQCEGGMEALDVVRSGVCIYVLLHEISFWGSDCDMSDWYMYVILDGRLVLGSRLRKDGGPGW